MSCPAVALHLAQLTVPGLLLHTGQRLAFAKVNLILIGEIGRKSAWFTNILSPYCWHYCCGHDFLATLIGFESKHFKHVTLLFQLCKCTSQKECQSCRMLLLRDTSGWRPKIHLNQNGSRDSMQDFRPRGLVSLGKIIWCHDWQTFQNSSDICCCSNYMKILSPKFQAFSDPIKPPIKSHHIIM